MPGTSAAADVLSNQAAAVTDQLRAVALSAGLLSAETARVVLSCTAAQLDALAIGGHLDMLVVDGQRWVNPVQVQQLALDELHVRTESAGADLTAARRALTGYLAAREATGSYAVARDDGRPLVCARRGRVWVHTGLEFHSVAVPVIAVTRWLVEQSEADRDLIELPAGAALHDLLCSLDGIGQQYTVTPQTPPRQARRVRNWIRVDPARWTVRVPAPLLAELEHR